jgi:transposase
MLGVAMYTTIKTLWERTKNKTEIARLTGHDWKTVAKVIKNIEAGIEIPQYKPRGSLIDAYRQKVLALLEKDLNGVRIYQELTRDGFKGSYPTVKRYINKLKRSQNIFVRINTEPGEEAQVDFGYAGLTKDDSGKSRKTWVFDMRLSYSRLDYYQKVYDQKVETFIAAHINAFEAFGGVPKYVRIDNLKSAILKASFYEPLYQLAYKDFARYYGFSPLPCRIRRPNDKGKVESGIRFVKGNFFKGRKFASGKDLDCQLKAWNSIANQRVHGTTRKVPLEVFTEEEKSILSPLPPVRFAISKISTRKVYHDCHIYVDYNYYSVPYEYVGKIVDVEITDSLVKVFYGGKRIALHKRIAGRGLFSTVESHYPAFKIFDATENQKACRQKMKEIGVYCEKFFGKALDEKPKSASAIARGVLSLKKLYPDSIIEASCKRALFYGAIEYRVVKSICRSSAYVLPLEEVAI